MAADGGGIAAGAEALVRNFAAEGLQLLEDRSASPAARAERFRALLQKYFAVDAIARWVLGRYWGQFDAEQRAEYRRLFEDLVVYGYVKRFGEYTGESIRITRTQADGEMQATVFSAIDRPAGAQPVRVDWRVGGREGAYRITDVIVENVSLSQTWRSDFAGTIQQGGGPPALLETLRLRTTQLKADLGVRG
ncbi:MAG: ABC transporter substrate-binding protein [Rhizobiaceae bacterium]